MIAHSLLVDGDLQIENNHAARDYQPYWSGLLSLHFRQRGIDRVIYSIHAPGFPVLLLPFYAVAGHWGAVALTIPFAPQSWLIFHEMPAALVMAWVAAWLFGPLPAQAFTWIGRGVVLGVLPWLHMKYSFLLVGATVCLLIRL